MKVFIASTHDDLEAHRSVAQDAVLSCGMLPSLSKNWPATGKPVLKNCLDEVCDCDLVIAIVAHSYGWVPDDNSNTDTRSITWLECACAHDEGLPVLPFIVDRGYAEWPAIHREEHRLTHEREKAQEIVTACAKIEEFKNWLSTVGSEKHFTTPDSLKSELILALKEFQPVGDPPVTPISLEAKKQYYLKQLARECADVSLLGYRPEHAHTPKLDQVYVPALTRRRHEPSAEPESDLRGEERQLDTVLSRLGEESLYLHAGAGSGKTIFCQWLALCLSQGDLPEHPIPTPEDFRETLPEAIKNHMPVLIRLGAWGEDLSAGIGGGDWSESEFVASLNQWLDRAQPQGLTSELLAYLRENDRCLFIFDGVDEIPEAVDVRGRTVTPRANFLSGLVRTCQAWLDQGHRVLLTSRPYGVDDEYRNRLPLAEAPLAPLPDALIDLFVRRWYAMIDPGHGAGVLEDIDEALSRPEIVELRDSPLMLASLCIRFHEGKELPEDVYELYDGIVDTVLASRYRYAKTRRETARRRLGVIAQTMHTGEAIDESRTTPARDVSWNEVDRALAAYAGDNQATEGGADQAAGKREDLLSESGLLIPGAGKSARFQHFGIQEFLAGWWPMEVEAAADHLREMFETRSVAEGWRRTLVFAFCALCEKQPQKAINSLEHSLAGRLSLDTLRNDPTPVWVLRDCLEIVHARGWQSESLIDGFRRTCDQALAGLEQPISRCHLWLALGRMGLDRRPGVGLADNGLPDIAWADIGGGEFIYQDNETRHVDAFRISKYPVTNAQFQAFVDAADGYLDDQWWGDLKRPDKINRSYFTEPNCPRTDVDWFEAAAFCRWLSTKLKLDIRLPTEEYWERAARDTAGRSYPWGEGYRIGAANTNESLEKPPGFKLGRTSPVGLYSQGESHNGVADLAGNVWEWCDSRHDGGEDTRVLRGGSWRDLPVSARSAYRAGPISESRDFDVGFRLWCSPP